MKYILLVFMLLMPLAAQAQTPEEKGLAIAIEADRRDNGFGDSVSEMTMTLKNRHGDESVRQMRAKILEVPGDGDKSLTIFDNPRDVSGTAFLTHTHKTGDDDQWLYLPALKRVKRISSSNKSGSFMGSEFAYEDISSQEVEKFTYKWLKDEPCPGDEYKGQTCFVLEQRPVDKNSGYTREEVWMDQQEYRAVQIDFYDRKKSLLKTLTFHDYKQYLDQYWRAHELHIVNHQNGKSTRLHWSAFTFRTGLGDADFNENALKRVR